LISHVIDIVLRVELNVQIVLILRIELIVHEIIVLRTVLVSHHIIVLGTQLIHVVLIEIGFWNLSLFDHLSLVVLVGIEEIFLFVDHTGLIEEIVNLGSFVHKISVVVDHLIVGIDHLIIVSINEIVSE